MQKSSTRRDANATQRAILAIQLRTQKMQYSDIANRAGYANASAARNAIQRELERTVVDNVEELRKQELLFLDTMHAEIWPMFVDKKNTWRLQAADRLLAISERRSKLMGLDMSPDQAAIANTIVIREAPKELLELMNVPSIEMIEKEK